MSKQFLVHIAKYICGILIFIMIFTMISCSTTSNKRTADLVSTAPADLSSPLPKFQEFSIEKDKIDYIAIVISGVSQNEFNGNRAKIYDAEEIEATIQALKDMEIYLKDESYQYYGGDTPYTMINFFDKQDEIIESINIYLDLKLNELVFRYHGNIYKISFSEIDKLYEICDLYETSPTPMTTTTARITGNQVTSYKYNKNDELLCADILNTDTEEDSVVISGFIIFTIGIQVQTQLYRGN